MQNRQNGHPGAGHEAEELRGGRGRHRWPGHPLQGAGLHDTEASHEERMMAMMECVPDSKQLILRTICTQRTCVVSTQIVHKLWINGGSKTTRNATTTLQQHTH